MIIEDNGGYHRLRRKMPIRLAAGEGEHTVYGCRDLIAQGSVGVIQPDVSRSGGITETRRIASLAYAFNMPLRAACRILGRRVRRREPAVVRGGA